MTDNQTIEQLRLLHPDAWAFFILGDGPYYDDRMKDDPPLGKIPSYGRRAEGMDGEERSICARKAIAGAYASSHDNHYPDEGTYRDDLSAESYSLMTDRLRLFHGSSRGEIIRFTYTTVRRHLMHQVRREEKNFRTIDDIETMSPWHRGEAAMTDATANRKKLYIIIKTIQRSLSPEDQAMIDMEEDCWEVSRQYNMRLTSEKPDDFRRRKAAEMGISVQALYTRSSRAIARLREKVREYDPGLFD